MTILLTNQEKEEIFLNALCNAEGTNYMAGYGLEMGYEDSDYQAAKSKLNNPCYEDVLLQILKDGGSITYIDIDGDGEYTSSITLNEVYERFSHIPKSAILEVMEENDDASTADTILQSIFFKEVIFG